MVPRHRATESRTGCAPRASGDGPTTHGAPGAVPRCSPRERGWSVGVVAERRRQFVLPARAGMVPWRCGGKSSGACAPRASGDGPCLPTCPSMGTTCSPRERGWSQPARNGWKNVGVLPARAGMVPTRLRAPPHRRRAPRASGDGPSPTNSSRGWTRCSPRERGWSLQRASAAVSRHVLPARAGMVPSHDLRPHVIPRAPRASGDGPSRKATEMMPVTCSPRERGWSHEHSVV